MISDLAVGRINRTRPKKLAHDNLFMMNDCCEKWSRENARPLNPCDSTFDESQHCPKCRSRLLLTFRRDVNEAGKFTGYVLITAKPANREKRGLFK